MRAAMIASACALTLTVGAASCVDFDAERQACLDRGCVGTPFVVVPDAGEEDGGDEWGLGGAEEPTGDAGEGGEVDGGKPPAGECSRDCLGGGCVAGQCQPLVLAYSLFWPTALAADEGRAFYSDNSSSDPAPMWLNGVDATTLAPLFRQSFDGAPIYSLAYGGGLLYAGQLGAVRAYPAKGGAAVHVDSSTGAYVADIIVASDGVYWASHDPNNSISRAGQDLSGEVQLLASTDKFNGVRRVGTHVWGLQHETGNLLRANLDGSAVLNVPAGLVNAERLAAFGEHLFVGERAGDQRLIRVRDDAAGGAILAQGEGEIRDIAADEDGVYWLVSNGGTGALQFRPHDDTSPITLASGQLDPVALSLDSISVYWLVRGAAPASGTGALLRVRKPRR